MRRKHVAKRTNFARGRRVLFRYYTRRAAPWLSGVISDGAKSKEDRLFYQISLDNGESRWDAADRVRDASL
jgi:hypothetical protein